MRIGLLGGTFDPVHNAHLALAGAALKQLYLDKVIFIPAYIPPHKAPAPLAGAEDRFKMLEAAAKGQEGFEISRYEVDKQVKSYTIDTLEYFRGIYPQGAEFFFLIGEDSLGELGSWKDIGRLLKLCKFAFAKRQGFFGDPGAYDAAEIEIEPIDISSTGIRERIAEGKGIRGLLPQAVEEYIKKNNLYK